MIVSSIATVAKEMHLETVAEFVETPAHSLILQDLGIDFAQGYGVAKPLPMNAYLNTLFEIEEQRQHLSRSEAVTL